MRRMFLIQLASADDKPLNEMHKSPGNQTGYQPGNQTGYTS